MAHKVRIKISCDSFKYHETEKLMFQLLDIMEYIQ